MGVSTRTRGAKAAKAAKAAKVTKATKVTKIKASSPPPTPPSPPTPKPDSPSPSPPPSPTPKPPSKPPRKPYPYKKPPGLAPDSPVKKPPPEQSNTTVDPNKPIKKPPPEQSMTRTWQKDYLGEKFWYEGCKNGVRRIFEPIIENLNTILNHKRVMEDGKEWSNDAGIVAARDVLVSWVGEFTGGDGTYKALCKGGARNFFIQPMIGQLDWIQNNIGVS